MATDPPATTETLVLDDTISLSLSEITQLTGVRAELIAEMVTHDILRPAGRHSDDWRFSAVCLTRVRCALRLRRDLELNWPGVGLAVELLEELQDLRRRHRALLRRMASGGDRQ